MDHYGELVPEDMKGYRILKPDEIVLTNDQFLQLGGGWAEAFGWMIGKQARECIRGWTSLPRIFRRKIKGPIQLELF